MIRSMKNTELLFFKEVRRRDEIIQHSTLTIHNSSFVAQRLNRIELRCFDGRVETRNEAYDKTHHHA